MTRPIRPQALAVAGALWLSTSVAAGQPAELIIRGGTIVTAHYHDLELRHGSR